jgi:uncharacterized protein YwqG
MTKRHSIEFVETKNPIRGAVTKFGGQPAWIAQPQWPLSAQTGRPMRFICQIALDPELFGPIDARVAYLFITDEEEHVDGTWEPDGGENAVILQPGSTSVPVTSASTGPTLYRMAKKMFRKRSVPQSCEFGVKTVVAEDHEFVPEEKRDEWSDDQGENYWNDLLGNKIGGTPLFIQSDEFPDSGRWKLLLQLDSAEAPFHLNLGDAGVGYAFLSEDGKRAKFLWQCT